MEDGLSSFVPENLELGLVSVAHDDTDADVAADAAKREQQLDESFDKALNDLLDDDDVDNDDDNNSDSSDDDSETSHNNSGSFKEKSLSSSHHRSHSYVEQSSVKESYEHSIEPNDPNQHSSLIQQEFSEIEQQSITNSNIYHPSTVNHSNISDGNYSDISDQKHSNISNVYLSHGPAEVQVNGENVYEYKSGLIRNSQHPETFVNSKPIESLYVPPDKHNSKDVLDRTSQPYVNDQSRLYEEYRNLQILYNARAKELEQVKWQEIKAKENYEKEIKSFKLKLELCERDKDKLTSSLQESRKLISDFRQENSTLKGKLNALEIHLSAETTAKEDAQAKLDSAEITIQSLEQQINGLTRSGNAFSLQQQNESVVRDLKLRHQKEVLHLKEEIDKLQGNLNDKIKESESMLSKISILQQKCEDLQIQKSEIFNKLSANLEASQKDYQKLLESGAISEVAMVKLQLQHLQKEKSELEKQNSALKDEVKSLEIELETSTTVKNLAKESQLQTEKNKAQSNQKESDLNIDLQQSLKNMQLLRTQNRSLKEKLEELKHRLPLAEERANLFESRYKESDVTVRELQKKLEEVLPAGSIPTSQHEMKVNYLENQKSELQKKLQDVTGKLESLSSIEGKLHEENIILKRSMDKMQKTHDYEKKKAVALCREKYLEIHGDAIKNLREDLSSKTDNELKSVCRNYENKIAVLERENELLNDGLYDSKAQYVKIFEENKLLQSKIDSHSKSQGRKDIEKEVYQHYEKKINEMNAQLQKYSTHFESLLNSEVERVQEEWTKQKMVDIKEFINATKQRLDEEFVKCLEKEKNGYESRLVAENEKISLEFLEKINKLKQEHEVEKSNLNSKLTESFQLQWKNQIKELQQSHQTEIETIRQNFMTQIETMENEIKTLKDKTSYDSEVKAEMEKLKLEYQEKVNDMKLQYEAEKNSLVAKLRENFQIKWKNEVKDMQQSHQNEVKQLKEKSEKEISALQNSIKVLQDLHEGSETLEVQKKEKTLEIQILKEKFSNEKQAWENEKLDLIKNEHVLTDKLSTARGIEKRLVEKIRKYSKYVNNLKKKQQGKIDEFQKESERLKKSVADTETRLQLMKKEHDQSKQAMEEKLQKCASIKNSGCQTEEEVVSRKTLLNVHNMFLQCLKKISEEIKFFLRDSRKRSAEQLHKALYFYHDRLVARVFQDVLKDARSISPDFCIPVIKRNFQSAGSSSDNLTSPNIMKHHLNSDIKISNSTPVDVLASNGTHRRLDSNLNNVSNVRMFQNVRSSPDDPIRLEDESFDFVPVRMHDPVNTIVKLPEYNVPRGLFH